MLCFSGSGIIAVRLIELGDLLNNYDNPEYKAKKVRAMFGAIAERYDFLNHFLSANLDRGWRRVCVREVSRQIAVASPKILDIGCGTADLSIAFSDTGYVTGCDFCHEMLVLGARKAAGRHSRFPINLLEADALALPFPEKTFDAAVSAFVPFTLAIRMVKFSVMLFAFTLGKLTVFISSIII